MNCNSDPVGDFVHICEKDLEMIDGKASLRLRFEQSKGQEQRDYDEDSSKSAEGEEDVE